MSPEFQTVAALVIVAIATLGLLARARAKRQKPGCGGDCGCPTNDVRSKLKP